MLLALLSGGAQPAALDDDPLAALRVWMEDFQRRGRELTEAEERALSAWIGDLRMERQARPERSMEIAMALLDLSSLEPRRGRVRDPEEAVEASALRARTRGREALRELLVDPVVAEALALNVLALPGSHPPARRVALLEVAAGGRHAVMLRGILEAAIAPEAEVRAAAWAALSGWPDESVHSFFLRRTTLTGSLDPALSWLEIREHFGSVTLAVEGPAAASLRTLVSAGLLATDWRQTVRALQLIQALPDGLIVPELIEALAVWLGRGERGQGSARIAAELMAELRRRIGVAVGPFPERWAFAWRARKESPPREQLPEERTTSGFFGLRPATDRVAFVVDRSGSMSGSYGFQSKSRYQEALEQMEQLLRTLGPSTRFRVILFDSDLSVWSPVLKPATEGNILAARSWAAGHGPRGGTVLRPAIEEVLRLKPDGLPDLAKLEEDTVIVLCDGATEGAHWVQETLARANGAACLVFHSVQIGAGGDGALRQLATLSGGQFVLVSP